MTDDIDRLRGLLHDCPPEVSADPARAGRARRLAARMRRRRRMGRAGAAAIVVVAAVPVALQLTPDDRGADPSAVTCATTMPSADRPPRALRRLEDPALDGGGWYGADDLWVSLPTGRVLVGAGETPGLKYATFTLDDSGRMTDEKGPPTLSARRLDAPGAAEGDPIDPVSYAGAVGPDGRPAHFWPTTITLPDTGCWELTERLGATRITFVVRVRAVADASTGDTGR